MNHSKFAVISFENRNGVTSWRVDGRLHGVRIRKNFETREDAAAENAVLEIRALQTSAGLRQIATALMDAKTEDYVRVYTALKSLGLENPQQARAVWLLLGVKERHANKRPCPADAGNVLGDASSTDGFSDSVLSPVALGSRLMP